MEFTTWDIEAKNWNKIVAISYYSKIQQGIVRNIFEILKIMENTGGAFFAHAAGIYDNKFLIKEILKRYNKSDIKIKLIHNTIGHIEIKDVFILRDSFYLFPESLRKLAKGFEVGEKMDIDREKINEYSQKEIDDYALSDSKILFDVLTKAQGFNFNIENLTLPQNAFKYWKSIIDKKKFDCCKIYKKYDLIFRKAYFGGRTEVFTRYGENLNYYDINSMYPYVMRNFKYPIGKPLFTTKYKKNYLGIYHLKVNIPKDVYLPPVPKRDEKTKKVLFPTGEFETYLTNAEIELITRVKGKYKIIDGYYWINSGNCFKRYVNYWHKIKEKHTGARKVIAKYYLNTLYGKLAQRREFQNITFDRPENYEQMFEKEFNLIWHENENTKGNVLNINENDLQIWSYKEKSKLPYTFLHIGLFVTSYARVILYNIMENIISKGGKIYYCDTDSVFTNIELETGNKIGSLGQENKNLINECFFVSPKLYGLSNLYDKETKTEKEKIVAKGCNISQINLSDFKELLENNKNIITQKSGIIGFLEGIRRKQDFISVRILEREISGIFNKRTLIDNYETIPLNLS